MQLNTAESTAGTTYQYGTGDAASTTVNTNSTGGDGAHNNMPPYIVLNYCIKY
ncbi:MAG: hypothetical protein H6Q69_1090 [Firmicutes bacterium]|nr:hypothetical protein [Bacillota bacterium]